jgi:hypothetical protein
VRRAAFDSQLEIGVKPSNGRDNSVQNWQSSWEDSRLNVRHSAQSPSRGRIFPDIGVKK